MYALSLTHIKYFRTNFANYKLLELFFSIMSQFGDKFGVFLWSLLSFQFNNGAHAFITATQICIFVLVSQTMKSILREPRPLFVDSDINVADCKHMEFGNPSSHTYGASFTVPSLVWLLIQHYSARYKTQIGWNIKLPLYTVIVLLLLLLGFSRVFKGVHTYNQVLSGFVQGVLLGLIQIFVFYEDYFKFYVSIRHRSIFRLLFNRFMLVYCILFSLGIMQHFDTQKNF